MSAAALSMAANMASQIGMQIIGQAISAEAYSVSANFEVLNFTDENVIPICVDIIHGEVGTQPLDIKPAQELLFAARKSSWGLYGTEGAANFLVAGRVLFIYWQVPLTGAGGVNELALGLGAPGRAKHQIYGGAGDVKGFSSFQHRFNSWDFHQYGNCVRHVQVEDDKIVVRGTMDTSKTPKIKLEIVPLDKADFARKFMQYL